MTDYYHNELLFSEIYLEEITKQVENADILASLKVLAEYRQYADTRNLQTWKESYVHEVLAALGFYAKSVNDHLTHLFPVGSSGAESPLSVCYVILPEENLDNTTIGCNWAEKIIRALRENELQWGLLTNGKQWRVYHLDEPTPYENYLEIDLESILADNAKDAYQIFHKFLKAENFAVQEKTKCRFDLFKKESQDKIDYIEKELANALKQREEGGQGVLSDLCMGYVDELRRRQEGDLEDDTFRKKIYHGAMLYMFRLLFLFYADARQLLSDDNHELLAKVETECRTRHNGEAGSSLSIWDGLEQIFVDIDQTYNGGLFSPQESEFTLFLSDTRIKDTYLVNVIFNLTTYREKDGQELPISYRDMSVRHLGTLYEGLLEHKLFIADEDTEVKVSKGKIQFIPASQGGKLITGHFIKAGDIYFAGDASERKSSGSYFTPEDVVDFIVNNTVGDKIKSLSDAFLLKQMSDIKAFYASIDDDERQSLSKLIEDNNLNFIRMSILNLSVLDPAMGSGHFLVNATNLISNFITKFLNESGIQGAVESSTSYWRRWVVENCIYGVDLNPLAVELAKLSLWVLSMAKNQPLSFLNHHLKCGNSLVGVELDQIGNYPFTSDREETRQLSLFARDLDFRNAVEVAISKYKLITSHGSVARYDVEEKKAWLDEIEQTLLKYKAISNIHTGLFTNSNRIDESQYSRLINDKNTEITKQLEKDSQYFHWELEFPLTLLKQNGFDCIIGNPPYANFPNESRIFFENHYGSSTSEDLYTLFIEKLIQLIKDDGFGGFVLPLSLTFSKNMSDIRAIIANHTKRSWKVSSFDRIPDALFGGDVRTRNSILITYPIQKNESAELSMTPMYRWFTKERERLFQSIQYTNVDTIKRFNNSWPKIGSNKQVNILKLLFEKNSYMSNLFEKTRTEYPLFYSSTAYNWLTVTSNKPPVYDLKGNLIEQTKYGIIYFNSDSLAWFSLSIFSSLFSYWYWLVFGDGFDLTKKLLGNIPLSPQLFQSKVFDKLVNLGKEVQLEMESHVVYKLNAGKKIGNYNLRHCRETTDQIDELIFSNLKIPIDYLDDIREFCNSMIKTEFNVEEE